MGRDRGAISSGRMPAAILDMASRSRSTGLSCREAPARLLTWRVSSSPRCMRRPRRWRRLYVGGERRGAGAGADRRRARPDRADARARRGVPDGRAGDHDAANGARSGRWPLTPRRWASGLDDHADEVANWPETRKAGRFWGVLTSGSRKIAELPRLVVITNAGDPAALGLEAYGRRRAPSPALAVREHPGPAAVADRPAGSRSCGENAETDFEFDRLHLNGGRRSEDRLAHP